MKNFLLPAIFLALCGLALATDRPSEPQERLRQFQRDLGLIQALVDEGLNLAGEEEPLKRAQMCNSLAENLVQEIQLATGKGDEPRAAGLSNYLQTVLVRGVAGNLNLARRQLPPNMALPPELQSIGTRSLRITGPVVDDDHRDSAAMQKAVAAINQGRDAVAKAIKGN